MEREPISKTDQARDALLILVSGGTIAIIGAVAEGKILSQDNINVDFAVKMGGAVLAGAGLTISGGVRLITSIITPHNGGE
jgi:hypothetical protein